MVYLLHFKTQTLDLILNTHDSPSQFPRHTRNWVSNFPPFHLPTPVSRLPRLAVQTRPDTERFSLGVPGGQWWETRGGRRSTWATWPRPWSDFRVNSVSCLIGQLWPSYSAGLSVLPSDGRPEPCIGHPKEDLQNRELHCYVHSLVYTIKHYLWLCLSVPSYPVAYLASSISHVWGKNL